MKTLATNKKANFDYSILKKFEAGLVLTGAEVKSAKNGHISIKESFVTIKEKELFLTNSHINPYPFAKSNENYDPSRSRKLLVHKSEIKSLLGKIHAQGLTLIPLRVYTKKRLIKLEFALAKGKKTLDKRASITKRETDRAIRRKIKSSRFN